MSEMISWTPKVGQMVLCTKVLDTCVPGLYTEGKRYAYDKNGLVSADDGGRYTWRGDVERYCQDPADIAESTRPGEDWKVGDKCIVADSEGGYNGPVNTPVVIERVDSIDALSVRIQGVPFAGWALKKHITRVDPENLPKSEVKMQNSVTGEVTEFKKLSEGKSLLEILKDKIVYDKPQNPVDSAHESWVRNRMLNDFPAKMEYNPEPVAKPMECACCQAYYAKHQAYRAGCPECGSVLPNSKKGAK